MAEMESSSSDGVPRAISSELRAALITIVTAAVSAIATIAVAYVGGFFDVAKTDAASRGSISLERLKFSNELIKGALVSNNPANSLLFYADIGLLDGLTIGKVKEYANRESERLKQGGGGSSILPSFDRAARPASLWLDRDFMAAFAPKAQPRIVDAMVSTGNYLFLGFGINGSAKRLSAFLGQLAYETSGFSVFEENANYSKARLMSVFPNKFDDAKATEYANHPEKILSYVYANRLGNGSEESGDGWKYRGRGYLQFTGRTEYDRFSKETGVDLIKTPDLMGDSHVSLLIAAIYWYTSGLNALADEDRLSEIAKKISGGQAGIAERKRYADTALQLLVDKSKVAPASPP